MNVTRHKLGPRMSGAVVHGDTVYLAGTPEGMTVTITVEVTEVDRRRLGFKVEVHDEMDKAGEGTHERFIIDRESRLPRLQQKVDAWKAKRGSR